MSDWEDEVDNSPAPPVHSFPSTAVKKSAIANDDDAWNEDAGYGSNSTGAGSSGGGGFSSSNSVGGGGFGGGGGGFGPRGGAGGFGRGRGVTKKAFMENGDGDSNGFGGSSDRGSAGGGFGRPGGQRSNGFGGGGGRGWGRGGGGGDEERDDSEEGGGFKSRGSWGGGRQRSEDRGSEERGGGRRGGRFNSDSSEPSGDKENKPRDIYIPPAPPEDEESIFVTMDAGINFDKYDEIPVEVTGRDPPQNIQTFDECNFYGEVYNNVKKCRYHRPTPVQKYAIPIVTAGRDLMACAQTGSGKTAAFLLPVITRMLNEKVDGASAGDTQSPEVLIISPTRELTLQIYNEARKFVHNTIYKPVVCYGGTSVGHQLKQLERGCNILVGTPGRLLDFLTRRKVLLDNLRVLILDEADRMLDMGFEPEVRRVVQEFNAPDKTQRQTLMFSATFPEEIQKLAADFLNDHIFLTVGVVGGTTSDIQQNVIEVTEGEKREKLQEILSAAGSDRVLVFVETKRNADFLACLLSQEQFPTTSIHGDRFQREREEALRDFRHGRSRVLVATSVAARGLDIPEVKHVINYDLPQHIEEYVHRIGRTGRIGNKGMATAFFQSDRDGALARGLVKVLADAHQDVPEFLELAAEQAVGSNYGPAGGRFASKDIRYQGGGGRRGGGGGGFRGDGGGFGGDSSGVGNDPGGFGTGFGESRDGGFSNGGGGDEEDWD